LYRFRPLRGRLTENRSRIFSSRLGPDHRSFGAGRIALDWHVTPVDGDAVPLDSSAATAVVLKIEGFLARVSSVRPRRRDRYVVQLQRIGALRGGENSDRGFSGRTLAWAP
jgi:hypothetical protein